MFDLIEQEEAGIQLPVEQVESEMFVCYIVCLYLTISIIVVFEKP